MKIANHRMKICKLFVGLALFTALSTVHAGSGSGKIKRLLVHSTSSGTGVVMFRTERNANKASCSTASDGVEWAVRLDIPEGRAMYSLILSAQAQGVGVKVIGSGSCADWSDRERPAFIELQF